MKLSDLARRRLTIAALAVMLAATGGHRPSMPVLQLAHMGDGPSGEWPARIEGGAVELGGAGVRLLLTWGAGQLR